MNERLEQSELALESFKLSTRDLVSQMEKQHRIYGAGYPAMGGGPTHEQRDESDQEWDRLYEELKNASIALFREVGGQDAYGTWNEVCKQVRQKHSFDRFLNIDPDFISNVLIGSSEK